MPVRNEIGRRVGTELYSIEVYPPGYFDEFDPSLGFEKWAAVEVKEAGAVPAGMETIVVPEGLYGIFLHKGPATEGIRTIQYIFSTWLPASGFLVDGRPHLAVMGDRYRKDDPDSEEELWIPIRPNSERQARGSAL